MTNVAYCPMSQSFCWPCPNVLTALPVDSWLFKLYVKYRKPWFQFIHRWYVQNSSFLVGAGATKSFWYFQETYGIYRPLFKSQKSYAVTQVKIYFVQSLIICPTFLGTEQRPVRDFDAVVRWWSSSMLLHRKRLLFIWLAFPKIL